MSQKGSGYERISGDRYFTPAWVVRALLSKEKFHGGTVDPMAGGWDVVHALNEGGAPAYGFDIEPQPPDAAFPYLPMFYSQDFLQWYGASNGGEEWRNICSNPPYGVGGRLAVTMIRHALEVTKPYAGKVAMLLRVDFDSGHTRRPIFGDHPAFAAKYTLTKRIRWVNIPQGKSGPSENHAWFVWDWARHPDSPRRYGYLPDAHLQPKEAPEPEQA